MNYVTPCPACAADVTRCACSTSAKLRALGLTHRATGRGYEHSVMRGGVEVMRGNAHEVEAWVQRGGGR